MRAQEQYSSQTHEKHESGPSFGGWVGVVCGVVFFVLIIEMVRGTKKDRY